MTPWYFSLISFYKGLSFSKIHQRWSTSLAATRKLLEDELKGIKEAGTYKSERVIISKQGSSIDVNVGKNVPGKVLNFCANNYLGLSVSKKKYIEFNWDQTNFLIVQILNMYIENEL